MRASSAPSSTASATSPSGSSSERWVLGAAGEQAAVAAQYDDLPDELLELYTPRFHRRLADALGKLQAAAA